METNVVEKILKCLNLADRGGTPAEAAMALRMAQKLMTEYNIELADVEAVKQKVNAGEVKYEMGEHEANAKKYIKPHEHTLCGVCEILFGTRAIIRTRGDSDSTVIDRKTGEVRRAAFKIKLKHFTFIGEKTDALLSAKVMELLNRMIDTNAKALGHNFWSAGYKAYGQGFAAALKERAEEEKAAAARSSSRALIIVDNKANQVAAAYAALGKLTSGKPLKFGFDSAADAAGRADARNVNLNFKNAIA